MTWTPRNSIGSVLGPSCRSCGQRREVGDRRLAVARPDESGADAERRDGDERRSDSGTPPQALPPPCRSPTLAKPLVRVDGWEQHRHRGVDLIAALPVRSRRRIGVVLSDRTIRRLLDEGRIGIDPYAPELMQPSSLDVRVDRYFRVFRNSRYPFIDVKAQQEDLTELVEVEGDEAFILHPGEFVLGSTLERVTLPDDLVARLEGKALALDTEIPTPRGLAHDGRSAHRRPRLRRSDGQPTLVLQQASRCWTVRAARWSSPTAHRSCATCHISG